MGVLTNFGIRIIFLAIVVRSTKSAARASVGLHIKERARSEPRGQILNNQIGVLTRHTSSFWNKRPKAAMYEK